jgi:uncharacterized protein
VAVKILAVSDVELPKMRNADYLQRTYSDVDLLVSCGDMPVHYLDFIGSVLTLPLFFVRGNHDTNYVAPNPGGDDLHRRIRSYKGFSFAGLEGSIRYNKGAVQYTNGEMMWNVLALMPRLLLMRSIRGFGVDVMVTHSPPRGIHDIPDDFAHRGFKALLFLMYWARPKYLIHGHVDTWDNRKPRETAYCQTTVLNINPVMVLDLDAGS